MEERSQTNSTNAGMPSTQAGEDSPKLMKPKRLGTSIVAFCGAIILLTIVASIILDSLTMDFGIIIVMVLGVYVMKGSRRAAKWALAFSTGYFLAGFLVTAILISGNVHWLKVGNRTGKVSDVFFLAPLVAVFTLWALANLVYLYRYLVRSGADWMKEKATARWVAVPTGLIVVGLAAGVSAVMLQQWWVPGYAKPAAIEARYAEQIEWLHELATHSEGRWRRARRNHPRNVELFARPEILQVELQTSDTSHVVVTEKPHYYRGQHATVQRWVDWPVVMTGKAELVNGTKRKTATYHVRVIDDKGRRIAYLLTFDLKKLEEGSRQPPSQGKP